jgi:hypothetical protein
MHHIIVNTKIKLTFSVVTFNFHDDGTIIQLIQYFYLQNNLHQM